MTAEQIPLDPELWDEACQIYGFAIGVHPATLEPHQRDIIGRAYVALTRLNREIASEYEARYKCQAALRQKDAAMSILFDRLRAAGIDCSDLIP